MSTIITAGQMAQWHMPKMEKSVRTNVVKRLAAGDWKTWFTEGKTSNLYEDTRVEEASGVMRQVTEGAQYPAFGLNDGYAKRRTVRVYACAGEYTKLAYMTGQHKPMLKLTRALADAPNQMISDRIAAFIELADTSGASIPKVGGLPLVDTTAADGAPVFSTAHTFKSTDTVTYSNKTSAYQSLTGDTLWAAVNEVRNWRNNLNDLLNIDCKTLIVGFANHRKAVELIRSKDDSETANRSTNSINELGLTFKVYNRMINDTEWFLETTAENDYLLNFAWKPTTDRDQNKRTGSFLITCDTAFSDGVGDPRRFYANKAA